SLLFHYLLKKFFLDDATHIVKEVRVLRDDLKRLLRLSEKCDEAGIVDIHYPQGTLPHQEWVSAIEAANQRIWLLVVAMQRLRLAGTVGQKCLCLVAQATSEADVFNLYKAHFEFLWSHPSTKAIA